MLVCNTKYLICHDNPLIIIVYELRPERIPLLNLRPKNNYSTGNNARSDFIMQLNFTY